jgi:hypothetical protein
MTFTASPQDHRRSQRAIDAHFAGRVSEPAERAMRAHLPACASCRRRYDRHLLLARLDPRALPAEQRMAVGLGFRAAPPAWKRRFLSFAVPLAVAAVIALVVVRPHDADDTGGFTARGAPASIVARFWTYEVNPGGPPRLLDRAIGAGDYLAFAYSNPAGRPFVMIFGVDEQRHVYWFHPDWPANAAAPSSIPAVAGPGPHELPGAVLHQFEGRRLNIVAVLSDRALSAAAIEAQVAAAGSFEALPSFGEGISTPQRVFEVRR